MADSRSVLQQSGLAMNRHEAPGLCIEELTGCRITGLRRLPLAKTSELPRDWPRRVDEVGRHGAPLLCLRPDECLLVETSPVQGAMRPGALPGVLVSDRSHALALLRLNGSAAPWLLAKLGSLDFRAARTEHCAQTRLAQQRVIVHGHFPETDGVYTWDLLVERSLARHLFERLLEATPHALELSRNQSLAQAASGGRER